MAESTRQPDPLFLQLVLSLQMGAWQQLGKIANPMTGKVERDLPMAKMTIDMLGMIQQKTSGNLESQEKQVLDHALYELRLNYIDEAGKGEGSSDSVSTGESGLGGPSADRPGEAQPGQNDSDDTDDSKKAE